MSWQRYDPLADNSCYYIQHFLNSRHPDRYIQLINLSSLLLVACCLLFEYFNYSKFMLAD